jgi:hypothetical protein
VSTLLNKAAAVTNNGAWAAACVSRGAIITKPTWIDTTFQAPQNSGYTAEKAISNWVTAAKEPENHKHIDSVSWPNNKPCSGVTMTLGSLQAE